jgi:thiamine biosynthesis protein ThiS
MTIVLNGEPAQVPDGLSVTELLRREGEPEHHVLVEINHLFVPPAEHATRRLREGDRVEIILPAFGG